MSLTIPPARIVEESNSPLLAARPTWIRKPLGEVAEILNGFAFKSKDFVESGGVPLIRIRDIYNDSTVVQYRGKYDERYIVRPGDVLVGMDGDFNCTRWRGPEALLNQRVCKITPNQELLDLEFLTFLLPGYLEAIHDLTSSTTVTHLSSRDVAQIPIPVPPLPEQLKLSDVLRREAELQGTSEGHLDAAIQALVRFRQAVLAAAVSGRLTRDWREQSQANTTAEEAISSQESEDLPDTWRWASVGEIGEVHLGGTPSRKEPTFWNGDIPWVSSGEVANCRISSTREKITEVGLAKSNAKMYPAGTVLIAMIGEGKTRGQSAILDINACTNQNVAGIFPDREIVNPEYVWRWALAQYEITRAVGRGGVQPALNQQKVKELTIPIPPIDEQSEIVRRIDLLLAAADQIFERTTSASRALKVSRHAVLAKAFRGDLIAETSD